MVASDIISQILQRYKMLCAKYPQSPSFIPNTKGDSFYLISNRGEGLQPTQIRLSNHGTYLETWCDRNELGDSVERLNPALCVNISIAFVDEGGDLTKDCKGMANCEGCEIEPCKPQTFEGQDQIGRPFTVIQYVYSSKCIRRKYINGLTKAIAEASTKGKYIDPLADLYRAAKDKEFHSSTKLQNNKGLKPENKQYKRNTNMNKKLIRLTESDLHRIVKESVNRIINEIGDTEKGQRALGALTAAKFKGKKKGDWGEVAIKASDERDKASDKAAKRGYDENEPWSSLMAWHRKGASMSGAYNDGYQKQVNESGFYPMEYDSKMGYYTPNGTVDGVDTYMDFDEMSFSELKALRDKYLEQVGHTPWNKIANARPDIFHAVNAIEEELEDRRERYREGDKSALS